jgi:hypothetical protein
MPTKSISTGLRNEIPRLIRLGPSLYDGPIPTANGGLEWELEHCPVNRLQVYHWHHPGVILETDQAVRFYCQDCPGKVEWPELSNLVASPDLPGVFASQIEPRRVDWLWQGHIPLGEIAVDPRQLDLPACCLGKND